MPIYCMGSVGLAVTHQPRHRSRRAEFMPCIRQGTLRAASPCSPDIFVLRIPSSEYYGSIRLPANLQTFSLFVDMSYHWILPRGVSRASQVLVRLSSLMPRSITPVDSPYLACNGTSVLG
jgi:hypothetical protein